MTTNDKLTGVLNDLIEINNDRVNGYEKAAEETKTIDVDLQAIFHKMADESRKYKASLTDKVASLGATPETAETTNSGKLYRVWMDVKTLFTGKDRQGILDNCEFGEDAAQKAYRMALASDAEMDADTRQLITSQQSSLKASHDLIKKYRDANKAVAS
ncbi:MAG: PA2169 family four-helix-bundle protein [Chitinophagaceae bacterium]|nr:PA2169 family four-helix-bundle protein [Chitinophagaceae bacterium]